jgi:CrcB protein
MINVLLAGFGGLIGSMLRYLINNWVYSLTDYPQFPYGVLIINIIGCLLIGFLSGLAETRDAFTPEVRIFIFIGILGGFTTFSSFGYDTFNLLRDGQFFYAAINVCVQVFVGLGAVWGGYTISRLL